MRCGSHQQIIVEELTKTFQIPARAPPRGLFSTVRHFLKREMREVRALDAVSFSIDRGELVGYIGPNGAGKSTTVKILSGILVPDSGRVSIMGRTPYIERIEHVRRIGVVFGQRTQLCWDIPVIESFELLREIYSVPHSTYRRTLDELVEVLRVSDLLNINARQLSLGQRMRCDLIASLLHEPELLFLDEPTIGLDAISKIAVREFIARLNKERGVTVILTTHDMDDIETLCRRVIVIGNGAILSDGTLDDLRHRITPERWLTIDFENHIPTSISNVNASIVRTDGKRMCLAFDPRTTSAADLIKHITQEHTVRDLFVENPPIESIIARIYSSAAE